MIRVFVLITSVCFDTIVVFDTSVVFYSSVGIDTSVVFNNSYDIWLQELGIRKLVRA